MLDKCRKSLSAWRQGFRIDPVPEPVSVTALADLSNGWVPWTRMPVSTCIATVIVISCVHKAVVTWARRPRRRDGKSFSFNRSLDSLPSTPNTGDVFSWPDAEGYELKRPKSVVRLSLAKAQQEEQLFSLLASLMRQVAFGFTCKALVNAILTTHNAHKDGVSALPAFFDSTDELTYAFLIRSAAEGFDASALAVDRQSSDVSAMLEALTKLRELWATMRLPLFVQTCIKLVQCGLALRDALYS